MIVAIYCPWQTVTTHAQVEFTGPLASGNTSPRQSGSHPTADAKHPTHSIHNINSLKFLNPEQPCIYHDAASIVKLDQEYVRTVDHFHVVDTYTHSILLLMSSKQIRIIHRCIVMLVAASFLQCEPATRYHCRASRYSCIQGSGQVSKDRIMKDTKHRVGEVLATSDLAAICSPQIGRIRFYMSIIYTCSLYHPTCWRTATCLISKTSFTHPLTSL